METEPTPPANAEATEATCPVCQGTGLICHHPAIEESCDRCSGRGFLLNEEATEAVAKPVPVMTMIRMDEKPCVHEWYQGICVHCEIPVKEFRRFQSLTVATAQPTPSGPTAGDSMDVHYAELKAECERLKGLLAPFEEIASWFDAKDAQGLVKLLDAGEREIQTLTERLTAAETKAGAMEEAHKRSLESDSPVGSCGCLTKSPEVKYHKPGCKYRLIVERDDYKAMTEGVPGGLLAQALAREKAALARAETAEAELKRLQDDWRRDYEAGLQEAEKEQKRCEADKDTHGLNFHQGKWHGWVGADISLRWPALPPAPSVAPSGNISNETVGIIPTSTTPTKASSDVSAIGVEAASHLLPFDLAKALAGSKVVTRRGEEVEKINRHRYKGYIEGKRLGDGTWHTWLDTGRWFVGETDSPHDLFLAPTP